MLDAVFDFAKMHGAGNDFVVVADPQALLVADVDSASIVRKICSPHFGLVSEGLLALTPLSHGASAFSMSFFNPDGSRASMCGNGARCAAFFAYHKGWVGKNMSFESDAGRIGAKIVSVRPDRGLATVEVEVTPPRNLRPGVRVAALPEKSFFSIDTGVPHAVCFFDEYSTEEFMRFDVEKTGRAVRFAPEFAPDGVNVDFARVCGSGRIALRTYERGVEAETGACGTGAIATAIAAAETGRVALPCVISVSGGDLTVGATKSGDGRYCRPTLAGPAQIVCEGRFSSAWFS